MCGISSYLCSQSTWSQVQTALKALKLLENRGYDSSGVALIWKDHKTVAKFISKREKSANDALIEHITTISQDLPPVAFLGHERWSTHGGITEINAHPHTSVDGVVTLVHNGIVENHEELRSMLITKGYKSVSQTDTEVIANLIAYQFREGASQEAAISYACAQMVGQWALVISFSSDPTRMYCVRQDSPLLIGLTDEQAIFVSEPVALQGAVDDYIIPDQGMVCTFRSNDGKIIMDVTDIHKIKKYLVRRVSDVAVDLDPKYSCWMEKEIFEQYDVVNRILSERFKDNRTTFPELDTCLDGPSFQGISAIILTGCGTSYHSAKYGARLMNEIKGLPWAMAVDGSEFYSGSMPHIPGNLLFICISQSGETMDLFKSVQRVQALGHTTISLVNVENSLLERTTDHCIHLKAGRENSVASTKSFISQTLMLTLMILHIKHWMGGRVPSGYNEPIEQMMKDIKALPGDIKKCLDISVNNRDIREIIGLSVSSMFVVGKGSDQIIAEEGALKIKEVTYIHAESYSSSSLKHGPFSLLDSNSPVVVINNSGYMHDLVNSNISEIMSKGAPVMVISDSNKSATERHLTLPYNKTFGRFYSIIPIQFMSYKTSLERGLPVDRPRNLAKTCATV